MTNKFDEHMDNKYGAIKINDLVIGASQALFYSEPYEYYNMFNKWLYAYVNSALVEYNTLVSGKKYEQANALIEEMSNGAVVSFQLDYINITTAGIAEDGYEIFDAIINIKIDLDESGLATNFTINEYSKEG